MYLVQGVLWEGREKGGGELFFKDGPGTQQKPASCSLQEHHFWFFLRVLGVPLALLLPIEPCRENFWLPGTASPRTRRAPSKRPQQKHAKKGGWCLLTAFPAHTKLDPRGCAGICYSHTHTKKKKKLRKCVHFLLKRLKGFFQWREPHPNHCLSCDLSLTFQNLLLHLQNIRLNSSLLVKYIQSLRALHKRAVT